MQVKNRRLEAAEIKARAQGHWLWLLPAIAPSLEAAVAKIGRHVPSPVRGGKDGFRLMPDAAMSGRGFDNQEGMKSNGIDLLMWVTGLSFRDVLERLDSLLGGGSAEPVSLPTPVVAAPQRAVSSPKKLNFIWDRGHSLGGCSLTASTPAVKYLGNRGISMSAVCTFGNLKEVNELFTREGGELVKYPGILARVTDQEGKGVTIHRTFLTAQGAKAPIESPKKLMPLLEGKSLAGASIKLGAPVDGYLAIAEGLETALSVRTATGIPCWSVISNFGMETFVPPAEVHTVVVFGDKDPDHNQAGQKAAFNLKQKLEASGIRVLRVFPKGDAGENGIDWNDVLVAGGEFPTFEQIKAV